MNDNEELVREIQRLAIERATPVARLLGLARVAAHRMQDQDALAWITKELNGYGVERAPAYRKLITQLMAFDPLHGWRRVPLPPKLEKAFNETETRDALPSLENLIRDRDQGDDGTLRMSTSAEDKAKVYERINVDWPIDRFVSRSQVCNVIEAVRTRVLEWTCDAECRTFESKAGPKEHPADLKLGQGHVMSINIGQNWGPVTGVNDGSIIQVGDFSVLLNPLKECGFSQAERCEIERIVEEALAADPSVKKGAIQRGLAWIDANLDRLGKVANLVKVVLGVF